MINTAKRVEVTAMDSHLALTEKEQEILIVLLTKIDQWRLRNDLKSIVVIDEPREKSEQPNAD
ncbi:TPA: hypothetical protein SIA28_000347 [Aeromonas salmonicida]|uniref:Uncharacterized protein n=1 Tax=Escherichia coli TaxID=562 RepID=A0A3L0Y6K2_ECOLX|nr:hypothetical protein [Aeromonas salmonicida]HEH9420618.1 hypothetical protein [Aeromonas salmonicida]HEH9433867.1 hypothetical protein [Aeromonas salmonicida]